jgi:tetratricopeptide (TPR) repeat protein
MPTPAAQNEHPAGGFLRYRRYVDPCRALALAVRYTLVACAIVLTLVGRPRAAMAAGEDAAAQRTASAVLENEYADGEFGPATTKLNAALDRCKRCSGPTKARLYVLLGMIASQVGKADEARNDFATALGADPNAKLPEKGTTPNIKSQWGDAVQLVTNTAPAAEKPADAAQEASPPPAAPAPAPQAQENAEVVQEHRPPAESGTAPRKIPGWDSTDAFQQAMAGLAADSAGKLDQCIEYDSKSLELEEQPRTRLHLSSCERRAGKLIDALRDVQKALESGIQKKDIAVMKAARARVQDLLLRIPHVTFQAPPGATDLHVSFDERDVPTESLTKKFSVDIGKHKVHAEGTLNGGVPLTFDQEYEVKEGELLTVKVALSSPPSEYLTPGQLRCMLQAKSQDEVVKCLPQNRKNLVVKAGMDFAGYADTTAVYVVTPSINGSISSPTAGWNVGGSFIVDIVSAASPDIVSEASLAYHEQRYAGVLTAGYKPGLYGVQVTGTLSDEPDYISAGGGIAVTADLNDKLTTPRLAFNHDHDEIGRGPNNFISTLDTTEVEAGVTMVLNSTTLLVAGLTGQFERGDQSKPYRYVPMFDPAVAPLIPPGASTALVNEYRSNVRPLEQLPTSRDRYAFGLRLNHRFTSTTLRIDERIYTDTWSLKATTTDLRYIVDMAKWLRLWPHARLNAQTGANFYQLAYSVVTDPSTASVTLPLYRSDDRELSPLITFTGGGGARIALSPSESKTQWGVNLSGDVMYTKYFDTLFITFRTAVYGAIGIDAEFE